jgi:hypothetical protein
MTCTIYYNKKTSTPHLWQIFTGFYELQAKGFLHLKLEQKDWLPESYSENLLLVDVDNQYKIIYDVNDGLNWLWGGIETNLEYFYDTLLSYADFYFKRSYNHLVARGDSKCKVYPLGFNYPVTSPENKLFNTHFDLKSKVIHYLRSNQLTRKMLKIDGTREYNMKNFEYIPFPQNKIPKLLFLTRLWDPGTIQEDKIRHDNSYEKNRQDIIEINEMRIQSIIACKKLYGKQFTGGLQASKFTIANYPDLVVPYEVSNKQNFLKLVKEADICIATTGLNQSIGWKFAEYVAAARGIVSEKMHFEVTGDFSIPNNYLEFNNVNELLQNIDYLIHNPEQLQEMMVNNYRYYNLYLRPDNLVLNSLLTAKQEVDSRAPAYSMAADYQ